MELVSCVAPSQPMNTLSTHARAARGRLQDPPVRSYWGHSEATCRCSCKHPPTRSCPQIDWYMSGLCCVSSLRRGAHTQPPNTLSSNAAVHTSDLCVRLLVAVGWPAGRTLPKYQNAPRSISWAQPARHHDPQSPSGRLSGQMECSTCPARRPAIARRHRPTRGLLTAGLLHFSGV